MQVPQWDVCTYLFCFLSEYYILSSQNVLFYIFFPTYMWIDSSEGKQYIISFFHVKIQQQKFLLSFMVHLGF